MNNREIVIKGIGKASVAPDIIVLEMTIEVCDQSYEDTMLRGTGLVDSLRRAIISSGHDGKELKTSHFDVNTKYERYQNKDDVWRTRFDGYVCTHGLRLEFNLDMTKLGATLGAIAECNANPKFNIRFSIKDRNAVSEQLLVSAMENAKEKAIILTKAAGVKLGAIQRVDYNWGELHLYSNTNMGIASAPPPMRMEVEPENITAEDTVTVVWSIE